jgi:hypothetical protein
VVGNKVVARYADGRIVKGMTSDFLPAKQAFHVSEVSTAAEQRAREIRMAELKALFFVKDFVGDAQHTERNEFDVSRPSVGRQMSVQFADGEVLVGTTHGYQPNRPGFFLEPADSESNIERCYAMATAIRQVSFI